MTHPTISVFVDTNVFIHLHDLKDLPWHETPPSHDWIEIVVALPVIEELDLKKVDRNNRAPEIDLEWLYGS